MSETNYGYDLLNAVELRKVIADLAKDHQQVASDKKDYVKATNEVLKENRQRTEAAVDALRNAEQSEKSKGLDKAADKILKGQSKVVYNADGVDKVVYSGN